MKINECVENLLVSTVAAYKFTSRTDSLNKLPVDIQNWRWAKFGDLCTAVREIYLFQELPLLFFHYLSVAEFTSTELGFKGFTWVQPTYPRGFQVFIEEPPKECPFHLNTQMFVPYPWAKGVIELANARTFKLEKVEGGWKSLMPNNKSVHFPGRTLALFFERMMKD